MNVHSALPMQYRLRKLGLTLGSLYLQAAEALIKSANAVHVLHANQHWHGQDQHELSILLNQVQGAAALDFVQIAIPVDGIREPAQPVE